MKRLPTLFDHANVGLAVCSADGTRVNLVNDTFARIHGSAPREILGKNPGEIFTPECMKHFSDGKNTHPLETTHIRRDGSPVDVFFSTTELRDRNGNVRHRLVNMIDLSARKTEVRRFQESTERLRETTTRLLSLTETIPDLVWMKDPEGYYLFCNSGFERFFGAPECEIVGKSDYDFLEQAQAALFREQDRAAAAAGKVVIDEETVTFKEDGRQVRLQTRKVPVFSPDGELTGVLGIGRDITPSKENTDFDPEREKVLRAAAENLPGFVYTYRLHPDDGEAFLYVSPGIESVFGLDAGTVMHDASVFMEQLHEEDRPVFREGLRESARTLTSFMQEFRIRHPQKGGCWLETRSVPETRPDGSTVWHGVTLDITERKQTEAEQQRLNRALQLRSDCNMLLSQADDEELLLEDICRLIVETGEYRLGWVAYAEQDESKNVRPAAWYGEVPESFVETIRVSWDDSPYGNGMIGTAIKTGRTDVRHDFIDDPDMELWSDMISHLGLRSAVTLPLKNGPDTFGTLNIYAEQTGAFGGKEVELLEKIAEDLAFGIIMLRIRGERVHMEALVRKKEQEFRALAENIPDSITRYDRDLRRIYANPTFAQTTGTSEEALLGKKPSDHNPGPDGEHYENKIREVFETGEERDLEFSCRNANDETVINHIRIVPEHAPEGIIASVLAVGRDITQIREAEERIEFLAHHDALTGLPNRLLARERMEHAIARAKRDDTGAALLFIDLDGFKTVNDSLGHTIGDALLKAVTKRLHKCIGPNDTISRQGGDEFLLILSGMQESMDAQNVAEKTLQLFEQPFYIDGLFLISSLSIGIACYPKDGETFDTLLQKADTAMYKAKESGKNTYSFYTDEMNKNLLEDLHMRHELKDAIKNGDFRLNYQPQIDLNENRIIGVESLLRWHHPQKGTIPPGVFIPVAESSGLITTIGEWIIQEACRQGARWHKEGIPVTVAVNISAIQFKRGNLEEVIRGALAESGIPPEYLELELTESIIIHDTESVLHTVRNLKKMGLQLSIDDFGTGYSSLSYLKRFAVDKLKIDQSFVRDILKDKEDEAIVRAIVLMAKSLGLKTIAEGVEDAATLELISAFGCDEVQGYHFATPMEAADFESFYRDF